MERFIAHAKGPKGLASIGHELAYAVHDIRQKVIEEATYGHPTTPLYEPPRPVEAENALPGSAARDIFYGLCELAKAQSVQQAAPEHVEHGPDR